MGNSVRVMWVGGSKVGYSTSCALAAYAPHHRPPAHPHACLQHRNEVGLAVLAAGLCQEGPSLDGRQQRAAVAELAH